jgi:ketosteroid isomerase-like protein
MPETAFFSPMSQALQQAFEKDDPDPLAKAHEQCRVDALKAQFDRMGQGDIASFVACLDPNVDMEIHAPAAFPWIRRARGAEAVRGAIEHNFGSVENQAPQILSVVAQGDLIDVLLQETGRIRATGQAYDVIGLQQFQFRQGCVRRFLEVLTYRTP